MADIRIHPNDTALMDAAAVFVTEQAEKAIAEEGLFTLALAGGGTPRPLYERLAQAPYAGRIDWEKVHIFWGDERCVPPDHKDSNYRMAKAALLDQVPLLEINIHRIAGELPPEEAAQEYEITLRTFFQAHGYDRPRMDLALLGMGHDGHTLSIFPGTSPIHETERWVVGHYIEGRDMWRITLTPPAVNAAACCAFLVAGANKAESLKGVLEGAYQPETYPSQLVKPDDGEVVWFVDEAAASELST